MEPLPTKPGIVLDNIAIKIKSIDGLIGKAYRVLHVIQFQGRDKVPAAEALYIFQMLWHFRMLADTCIRLHLSKVITLENKVSISSEIIEEVNNGNGAFKIEYAKFGVDVNSRSVYDWIKVMCDNTGTREKRTSYLFMGVNHQLFAEDEHLETLTSIVTKAQSAKTKSNGLPNWDIIDTMHENTPDSVAKMYGSIYEKARIANAYGIDTMDKFEANIQEWDWLCSMSVMLHKLPTFQEKAPNTTMQGMKLDWLLERLSEKGDHETLQQYKHKFPDPPVILGLHSMAPAGAAVKAPTPVFGAGVCAGGFGGGGFGGGGSGGGGYGASTGRGNVISIDDDDDLIAGQTVKKEPISNTHANANAGKSDKHFKKLLDLGFEPNVISESETECGSNFAQRMDYCLVNTGESGEGGAARGGSRKKKRERD